MQLELRNSTNQTIFRQQISGAPQMYVVYPNPPLSPFTRADTFRHLWVVWNGQDADCPAASGYIMLAEVQVWVGDENIAFNSTAVISTTLTNYYAANAIDGDNTTFTYSTEKNGGDWWKLDLGQNVAMSDVDRIHIVHYNDSTRMRQMNCLMVSAGAGI